MTTRKYHQTSPAIKSKILAYLSEFIPVGFDESHEKWNVWEFDEKNNKNEMLLNPMRAYVCHDIFRRDFTLVQYCETIKLKSATIILLLKQLWDYLLEKFSTEPEDSKK